MKKALSTGSAYHELGLPFTGIRLDHTVPEPFWRQLYGQMIALIGSGAVAEGKSLPPERDLAQALGVSRATVKRCYDVLRGAQILGGKGRAGSVVQAVNRVEPSLGKLKGFTQEMRELGLTPTTELIERAVTCDRMIASVFGRPSTTEFLRLVRVRKGDGLPMTREIAWYDLTIAPGLAQWDGMGSAYGYIRIVCSVPLDWAEQSVEAVLSSAQESQTFGFEQPAPCLLFKRKTYTAQQQLVEYVEGTFRGDAYVYKLKLEA
jgi:GntR family transcriptional regulator